MNYVQRLRDEIRRQLDPSMVPDEDGELLLVMYTLIGLVRGRDVTNEDVHNAWTSWMVARGEGHPSMVPFGSLPDATREKDHPFVAAIDRAVATVGGVGDDQ